jgi:hypothetical protein
MNINDAIKGMQRPANFYQQVDSSVYYILYTSFEDRKVGHAYYEALGSIPERVKASALNCFVRGESDTYHAKVIRAAMKHFEKNSYIDDVTPALSTDKLNGQ